MNAMASDWVELDVVNNSGEPIRVEIDDQYYCNSQASTQDHGINCIFSPNCSKPFYSPKLWPLCVPAELATGNHKVTVFTDDGGQITGNVTLRYWGEGSPPGYYNFCLVDWDDDSEINLYCDPSIPFGDWLNELLKDWH